MGFNYTGKVVSVTGAGGVLGAQIALAFAEHGASIALIDRDTDAVEAVAKQLVAKGYTAQAFVCDMLDKDSIEQAEQAIIESLGITDILINGVGGNHPVGTTAKEFFDPHDLENPDRGKTFFDLDLPGFNFVFNINFLTAFLGSQVFSKKMIGREGASIINISSINAGRPFTKIPAYSSAKAAVNSFTQWLAVYFAPVGIRVNSVMPGFFLTNQNRELLIDTNGEYTQRAQKALEQTPVGRFGDPKELTGVFLWLGDAQFSSFVTGSAIPVDGGFTAYAGV